MGRFTEAVVDRGVEQHSDDEKKTIIELDWEHDLVPTEVDEQVIAQAIEELNYVERARFRKS